MAKTRNIIISIAGVAAVFLMACIAIGLITVLPRIQLNSYLNAIDPVIDVNKKIETIFKDYEDNELPSTFEKEEIDKFNANAKKTQKAIEGAKKEVKRASKILEQNDAPSSAQELHKNIEDLMKFNNESLLYVEGVLDYYTGLANALVPFGEAAAKQPKGDDQKSLQKYTNEILSATKNVQNELKGLSPPKDLEKQNDVLVKFFDKFNVAYKMLNQGLTSLNIEKIEESEKLIEDIDKIDSSLDVSLDQVEKKFDKMIDEEDKRVTEINKQLKDLTP